MGRGSSCQLGSSIGVLLEFSKSSIGVRRGSIWVFYWCSLGGVRGSYKWLT